MSKTSNVLHDSDVNESDLSLVPSEKKRNVGERLMLARLERDLSIEQIAGQLKWNVRQIVQVEAGNYAVLPDHSSVRGFVRSYAKILKLDPVPLMDELSAELVPLPAASIERMSLDMPFSSSRMLWSGQHKHRSYRVVAGLVGLVLLLFGIAMFFAYRGEMREFIQMAIPEHSVIEENQLGTTSETSSAEQSVLPSTAVKEPVNAEPSTSLTDESVDSQVSGVGKSELQLKVSVSEAIQNKKFEQSQAKVIDPANPLVLTFKEKSWVQIKRLDGSKVVSRLYKAGEEEVVSVTEPLSMIIGYAPGVEAKLRGQPLMLEAKKGTTVVMLDVK